MRVAVIVGWALLVIEAVIITTMFVQPNMGDDAAGRGMARGFGIILGPVLLVAATLFVWGQRGGPRAVFWVGFGVMAIPLIYILQSNVMGTFNRLDRAQGKARNAKFADRRLTRLGRAIEKDDTATVRATLAEGPVDFTARSAGGRTLLGRAVEHALSYDGTRTSLETVRLLLDAGATPIPNAIEPAPYQGNIDAHLLVAYVFGGNNANAIPLLDMLLAAGADPNTPNYEGQPLYFSTYASVPKLEVLAKHGANFTALETTRTDRAGWTAAMSAADLGDWGIVLFLLDHGVSPDHVAPDGSTLRKIIEEKKGQDASDDSLALVMRRIGGQVRTP
jgi:hypothetical protein